MKGKLTAQQGKQRGGKTKNEYVVQHGPQMPKSRKRAQQLAHRYTGVAKVYAYGTRF